MNQDELKKEIEKLKKRREELLKERKELLNHLKRVDIEKDVFCFKCNKIDKVYNLEMGCFCNECFEIIDKKILFLLFSKSPSF
jgi:hypothetical protein